MATKLQRIAEAKMEEGGTKVCATTDTTGTQKT